MKDVYMIGNTHFDPVWLWQWQEAMASIHSTFRSALDRMKEDDDFIYSFATPPVFEWIKNTDPEMFEEIRTRVAQGRWEIPEGMWLQPDCFSASGESYARQVLYGQRYLSENFGKYADTVFNVDSFGHNSQTPQILKKSHIENYCLCRPENKHCPIDAPYFEWEGIDESKVRAFRVGQYSEIYPKDIPAAFEMTESEMKDAPCDEMMLYGVTNHGGAPTKKAIADIHALSQKKDYKIRFSTVSGYFKNQSQPTVKVKGELITGDFGPYVNHAKMKRANRVAEYAALNAEKASVIAKALLRRDYPSTAIDRVWKDVMFNQFHDILGGASTVDAYVDAFNKSGRAITDADEITYYALTAITHKIKTVGKNPDNPWNVTVWNLNPSRFSGYIEAELQWLHEFPAYSGEIELEDKDGRRYPCQIILEKSVIAGFRSRILFRAEIEGLGYKSFAVVQTGGNACVSDYKKEYLIKTDRFTIEFDKSTGFIKALTKDGKVYSDPIKPVCFKDENDTWCFKTDGYGEKAGEFEFVSLDVTERGIYRTTVKTTHTFNASQFITYYTFYNTEDYFDIRYSVNWNEKHTVLKYEIGCECKEIAVSSPFASEKRRDTVRDMPMGEWIKADGFSLIFNSAFGYNKIGNKLGITLLRSCIYGDLRLKELDKNADYDYMEQGITEGALRFITADTDVAAESAAFNNPPKTVVHSNHDGIFDAENVFVSVGGQSAVISALKDGYDKNGQIIRIFEYLGKSQNAKLNHFGKEIDIQLSPFEIKTLRISDTVTEVNITED